MSSILKALRKLEEEKRGGKLETPDLRANPVQKAAGKNQLLTLMAGVAAGAVLAGVLLFSLGGQPPQLTDPPPAPQTVPSTAPVGAEQMPPVASRPTINVSVPTAVVPTSASAAGKPARRKTMTGAVSQTITVPAAASPTGSSEENPPVPPQLPPGLILNVSEIYSQNDATVSMAVVNDLPVMVGTQIDNAVVVEIRPDRVLFRIEDVLYSVPVQNPE